MPSLSRRLTITHTLVALLAVLLVAALAGGLILRAYRQSVEAEALRQARAVATRLSGPLAQAYLSNRGWDAVALTVGRRLGRTEAPDGRLVISDAAGQVVFDSAGQLEGRPATVAVRAAAVPVMARGSVVGSVAVLPSPVLRAAAERGFVRSLAGIVVVGSLVAVGAALLVALVVARRLTTPLRELTVAARRIAAGERSAAIALPADAELAELAGAFNRMAAELARQEELRRQMVADIAHELRTPLSVLRLQVESMEDGIVPATPQGVGALAGELDLLGRLVDDLRLLSLAEAGQLSLDLRAVSPREALERAAAAAEPHARRRGVALQVAPGPPLPAVRADPQRLAQMLANLVENALRHTPAGGEVTLAGAEVGPPGARAAVVFEVRDTGPGIAAADLPHIFERFYRADRARARDTGGSGLGLAIVQRLAMAQGGSVAVASEPGQGATFRVTLPVA
ncbi:MAG: ATP-binding protein [Chloroflexi bacterium OHK40]